MDANLTLIYDPTQKVFASLLYKNLHTPLMDFSVKARMDLPQGLRFYVHEKVQESSHRHYKQDFLATFDAGYVMSRVEIPAFYNVEDDIHSVGGTVKVNNYPPIEINGALRPHWDKLKVKLAAVYEESTYGVEGNFDLENDDGYLMKTDLKIEYPNYQPKISLMTKREIDGRMIIDGSLEVTEFLKYSTQCAFNYSASKPVFMISFNWPENDATLMLEGSYAYTDGFEMTNSGRFMSSITGLESVGVEFEYTERNDIVDSKITIILSTETFIEGHINIYFKENGLVLQVLTPFEKNRIIKLVTKTKIMDSTLEHNSTLTWDDQYMLVTAAGERKQPLRFLGDIQLKSSYSFLDSLSIKALIDINHGNDLEFTVNMPNNQTFSIITNFMHSNYDQKSQGALILEIPGVDLPKQQFSWQLDWSDEKYDGKVDLSIMKESFNLISDGSSQSETDGSKIINFNFKTESSHSYFDGIVVSLEHKQETHTQSYNTNINGQYADLYQGHFHQSLKYLRNNFLSLDLVGEVETDKVYSVKLNSDNKIENGKYQSISHFSATDYYGGDMVGVLSYEGLNDVNANFKLTTLPHNSTLLELALKHLKENEVWTTKTDITYNENTIWTAESKVQDQANLKKVNFKLSTPLATLTLLEMSGVFEKTDDQYKLNGQIEHNLLEDKIDLMLNVQVDKPSLITFQFKLTSPMEPIKLVNIDIAYTHQSSQKRYTLSGLVEYNDQKCYLSSLNFIQSYYHFSSQTIIELPGYNKTVDLFGLYFLNDSGLKTELNVQTPFEVLNKIGYKLDYMGNLQKFNKTLTLHYNDHRYNQLVECDISTSRRLKLKSKIDSNTNYIQPRSLDFNHRRSENDFETSLKYVYGQENYSLEAEGNKDSSDNLEGKVHIQTPFEDYENVAFAVNLLKGVADGNDEWEGVVEMQVNQDRHMGNVNLVVHRNNSLHFKVKIESSLYFELILKHEGAWENFTTNVDMQFNQQSVHSTFLFDTESFETLDMIKSQILVVSSFENFEKLLIIFSNSRNQHQQTTIMDLQLPIPSYERFKFELDLSTRSDNSCYTLSVDMPFEELKDLDISMCRLSSNGSFQFVLKKNNNTVIDQTTTLQTITLEGTIFNLEIKLFPSLREEYSLQLDSRTSSGYLNAKAIVATPIEGHREYKAMCVHSFRDGLNIDSTLMFSIQSVPKMAFVVKGKITAANNFDLLFGLETVMDLQVKYALRMVEWKEFLSNLEMTLQPEEFNWLQLNIGYSVVSEAPDFSLKTGFQTYNDVYSTELTLKFNNGLKIVYAFETPFELYESFRFGLSGLRSHEFLELGVETNASFLPLPNFKAHHNFKGNFRNFISQELIAFSKDGKLVELKIDSLYKNIRDDHNEFNFNFETSFDELKNLKISHERIMEDSIGKMDIIYSANKKVTISCNTNESHIS